MRRFNGMKWVLLAGGLATAGVALAFDGPRGDREGRRAEMLAKFDANKDGQLDDAEREAARAERKAKREQMRAERMAKLDANKDGQIDDAERTAARAERQAKRFKALDTNGDNVLSIDEFKAGHEGRKGHGRRGHGRRGF